jgi:hypothetical protein
MRKHGLGFKSLPSFVRKGLKHVVSNEKPLTVTPVTWGLSKIFGKKKIDDMYWKAVSPAVKADIFLGSLAQKITPKSLRKAVWESNIIIPNTGKGLPKGLAKLKSKNSPTGLEYSIPSIAAPLKKVGPFGIGILGTMKAEELLKQREKRKMNSKTKNKPLIKAADLKKAALMLSHLKSEKALLEKKAKATELLYKQAEMGQIQFPKTHSEYEEKVAELMSKNLEVVEEAIKMASSSEPNSIGGLGKEAILTTSPHSIFAKSLIEN